ncbi:MAG TPA: hypothetical protein VGO43_07035 [Pyrinomonadaceae bacterium]|jgi:uncharacterized YccA/Bax inhibitor family protein|nr:hypothetical protein [Pyrinomonadaceae bacterium]
MLRIVLGVIGGFLAWLVVWFGSEKGLSAIWPAFGVDQRAFEEAVKNGGPDASGFTANTTMLLTQLVLGTIVSVMAGALTALIAGENTRAPLFFGILLLAMGIAKAVMSWQYVPIWYHVIFTAILLPMAIVGGKLISTT